MADSTATASTLVEVLDAIDAEFGKPGEAAQTWARSVISPPSANVEGLTPAELEWLVADEALWQHAYRIVEQNPELDSGDVYHTLRNFQRTPQERLRRGLRHGRTRSRTE
jgi:hypothetical protein